MNIYLVRHGELDWKDNIKKCIGITDKDLNENGVKNAELVGNFFKDKNIKRIYTSGLKRCKKTAQIISSILNIPYYIEGNLEEIDMGIWENKSFDYIKINYSEEYKQRGLNISDFRIEKGETFRECYERSKIIFKQLSEESYNDNIIMISHSGVIKSIICFIENRHIDEVLNIKLDYGSIIQINYNKNEYKILSNH